MADPGSRKGHGYATPEILDWLDRLHAAHDAPLEEAFDAPGRHGMPAIQLGPSESRLLEILLGLAGARRVVEIGTLAGYSAIRIARALPVDGRLWTIEADSRHAAVARDGVKVPVSNAMSVDLGGRYTWLGDVDTKLSDLNHLDPDFWTTQLGLAFKF